MISKIQIILMSAVLLVVEVAVFLFDIGTGSMENLFGLRPDFSKIDKVFLSHLHSDHFGDLDAFIVGS